MRLARQSHHDNSGHSRRNFLKMASATGVAMAAAPLLTACGDGPSSGGGKGGVAKLIHPSQDALVVWGSTYIAEDQGFYKKEGLKVERVLLSGGPAALTALLSGAGDVNLSTPGELLTAVTKGQKLRLVESQNNTFPSTLVISEQFADRLEITATSSLAERQAALGTVNDGRFGISAPGSQTDGYTRLALKQAGLDPEQDATIVPLQTASNMFAALKNGQIDGFIGVPPSDEKAVQEFEAVPLLYSQRGEIKGAEHMQGVAMQAREQALDENTDFYETIVRAEVAGLRSLIEDPDKAKATLRKTRFDSIDEKVWDQTWKNILPIWKHPFVTHESVAAWLDADLVPGATSSSFPIDEVINMDAVTKAVDSLGWIVTA